MLGLKGKVEIENIKDEIFKLVNLKIELKEQMKVKDCNEFCNLKNNIKEIRKKIKLLENQLQDMNAFNL